jgi:hypothetical protein
MADLLDAYRAYFRSVYDVYIQIERRFDHELDLTWIGVELATSDAETSVDRFSSEPSAARTASGLVEAALAS